MDIIRSESTRALAQTAPARRLKRRPRRRWWQREPEPPKTREEIAFEEAKKAVERRVGFFSHAVVYVMVLLLILVTAGFYPMLVLALSWGIGVASHGYSAIIAPGLQKRWLEEEYRLRLGPGSAETQRQLQGQHAKSLEALSASIAHEIRNPITAAKSPRACPDGRLRATTMASISHGWRQE